MVVIVFLELRYLFLKNLKIAFDKILMRYSHQQQSDRNSKQETQKVFFTTFLLHRENLKDIAKRATASVALN